MRTITSRVWDSKGWTTWQTWTKRWMIMITSAFNLWPMKPALVGPRSKWSTTSKLSNLPHILTSFWRWWCPCSHIASSSRTWRAGLTSVRLGGQIMTGYPTNDDRFLSNNHLFPFQSCLFGKRTGDDCSCQSIGGSQVKKINAMQTSFQQNLHP